MLAGGGERGDIAVRTAALLIAAILAVPACVALAWPRRAPDGTPGPARRPLDGLWAVVPFALLAVLAALAVTA